MNYYKFMERRASDIRYLRLRLQRLFSVLKNGDYDKLQTLLTEAENVLNRYLGGAHENS